MLLAGCTGLNALNPVCQLTSTGIDAVLSGLTQWIAGGALWLLGQIGDVLVSTTTIDVGATWFRTHYSVMTALAGVVVLPLVLVSTLQAIYRQNPGQLIKTFFVQLPLALLLGVVAVQIVILCLSATDALSTAVAGGTSSDLTSLLSGVTTGLIAAQGDPEMSGFVLVLVGLLISVAAFVLWLELLIRAAAVYVAVLFLPLALATLVWPSVSHWCRRLVETLAALILSKFVIVATLSLAAGAVASGTAGSGDHGSGFASVLAGGALLVLATFVPFSILRLIPMVEAGAIGHLDGLRQRATAPLMQAPRTAATFALREGMAAVGGARLAAQAGPVGTGGGGGGGGTGGVMGGSRGGGGGGGSGGGSDAPVGTTANGGLIPDANGMMVGIPGQQEEFEADLARRNAQPPQRGPKPVMGWSAGDESGSGGSGGGDTGGGSETSAGDQLPKFIGTVHPGHNRYYLDNDGHGPVLKFMPPAEPLPERFRRPPGGEGTT